MAVLRDKFPERVPFRLTRMLVNAMEVSGVRGTYRGVCESVLSVLRANADSVMTMLEAFVHDRLRELGEYPTKEGESKDKSEAPPEEDGDSTNKVEQMKSSALRNAMETAIAEGGAMDLMRRRESVIYEVMRVAASGGGATCTNSCQLSQPLKMTMEMVRMVFSRKISTSAPLLCWHACEKGLTGRDRIAYRIGHSGGCFARQGRLGDGGERGGI